MKKNSSYTYARALYEAARAIPAKEIPTLVANFFSLLRRQQKLRLAPRIVDELTRYGQKQEGVLDVSVTTATPLDAETRKKIQAVFGGQATITEQEDPSILGGIVIKTPNVVVDGSLQGQLARLKQQLL